MLRCTWPTSLALGVLLVAQAAGAQLVTLNPNNFSSGLVDIAREANQAAVQIPVYPIGFPVSGTTPGAVQGGSSAVTTYSLSEEAFHFLSDQAVDGETNSISRCTSSAYFAIHEDLFYEIEGSFVVVDDEPRRVDFRVYLHDITAGPVETLFDSNQVSLATVDESFTLGLGGGDSANSLQGSLTGTLLADHDYRFIVDTWLTVPSDPPRASVATGVVDVTLTFVPEPRQATLCGVAVVVVASLRIRRSGPGSGRRRSGRKRRGGVAPRP